MQSRCTWIASAYLVALAVPISAQRALADGVARNVALGGACQPEWVPTFGSDEAQIFAMAVYDDGSGPALHAAGRFEVVGDAFARRIAKWDGASWSALGSGINGEVYALAVFDDGSGPALYAGGSFTHAGGHVAVNLAKWDGSTWSPLVAMDGDVNSLAVHDDGSGSALYVGGSFTHAGVVQASHLVKWDGNTWSAPGSGFDGNVLSMAVYDDGNGPALYAGGAFTTAGGMPASRIARWDGATWTALGSGMNLGVLALTVHDEGAGPALFAAGNFTSAGGVAASRIARWDGSSWSPLGSGLNAGTFALATYDDGTGPALFAAGNFDHAGGDSANRVARWDGAGWNALGDGVPFAPAALAGFDDGAGSALYVGGSVRPLGGEGNHNGIVRWDGSNWSSLASEGVLFGSQVARPVAAAAVHDDGSGTSLFASGTFVIDDSYVDVARWDGKAWTAVGAPFDDGTPFGSVVLALGVHDDGSGPVLYCGGLFTSAGGVAADHIARWDGVSWSPLGSGLNGTVRALTTFDDGDGPALVAGGDFNTAGGSPANRIATWDGASWSPVGGGMNFRVHALAVFDDGGGPAVYAGGEFTTAGGVTARRIARWDGTTWSEVGGGVEGVTVPRVEALLVHDDGSGPALYVAGAFSAAGATSASNIARWDGSVWSTLGTGIGEWGQSVRALAIHDAGTGPLLFAAGWFDSDGVQPATGIASWNGSSWAALEGNESYCEALASYDDGTGPALFAGRRADELPLPGDDNLARWACADATAPTISCPTAITQFEFRPSASGAIVSFAVTATDDRDPAPAVECVPPSGSVFPYGTTLVTCTAIDRSGNPATCQFPVTVESARPIKKH